MFEFTKDSIEQNWNILIGHSNEEEKKNADKFLIGFKVCIYQT